MAALRAIEQGWLTDEDVSALTIKDIRVAVVEGGKASERREKSARIAENEAALAKARGDTDIAEKQRNKAAKLRSAGKRAEKSVTRKMVAGIKSGDVTQKNAAQKALEMDTYTRSKELPDINIFLQSIAKRIRKTLAEDSIEEQFEQLIKFQQYIDEDEALELRREFELLGDRAYLHAKQLNADKEEGSNVPELRSTGNGSPHHITVER